MAAKGEYINPPIHAPIIVGTPAISPIRNSFRILTLPALAIGATIAKPSVVLCSVNPTIRKVLNATWPSSTAAPIAKPSPKLCNPMPIAIINDIARGFAIISFSETGLGAGNSVGACDGVGADILAEGCWYFFLAVARSTIFSDMYSNDKNEMIVAIA